MQKARDCKPRATVDLPQSATESKEGVRHDQRGFPTIKVTQFTILPICVSAFCFEPVFWFDSSGATYTWLDRTHGQAIGNNEPARILQALKF